MNLPSIVGFVGATISEPVPVAVQWRFVSLPRAGTISPFAVPFLGPGPRPVPHLLPIPRRRRLGATLAAVVSLAVRLLLHSPGRILFRSVVLLASGGLEEREAERHFVSDSIGAWAEEEEEGKGTVPSTGSCVSTIYHRPLHSARCASESDRPSGSSDYYCGCCCCGSCPSLACVCESVSCGRWSPENVKVTFGTQLRGRGVGLQSSVHTVVDGGWTGVSVSAPKKRITILVNLIRRWSVGWLEEKRVAYELIELDVGICIFVLFFIRNT